MGILSRHSRKPPRFDSSSFVQFGHQLGLGRIPIKAIHPRFVVRTRCPDCDGWCYRLRVVDGGEYLLEETGTQWIHHQCPHPQDQDYDSEPL